MSTGPDTSGSHGALSNRIHEGYLETVRTALEVTLDFLRGKTDDAAFVAAFDDVYHLHAFDGHEDDCGGPNATAELSVRLMASIQGVIDDSLADRGGTLRQALCVALATTGLLIALETLQVA